MGKRRAFAAIVAEVLRLQPNLRDCGRLPCNRRIFFWANHTVKEKTFKISVILFTQNASS